VVAHARPLWSRDLLIDTAVELLRDGGAGTVTVDAVTTAAQISRATLYRQFPNCGELVAAAFRELVPPNPAPPATGDWQTRLSAVLAEQAQQVSDSPHLVAGLCWLALERGASARLDEVLLPGEGDAVETRALCDRMREWCIVPLFDVLDSPQAAAELGEIDRELVFALLIAPTLCGASGRTQVWAHAVVSAFAQAHTSPQAGATS
jgi:AcrR family transcriptional regulator